MPNITLDQSAPNPNTSCSSADRDIAFIIVALYPSLGIAVPPAGVVLGNRKARKAGGSGCRSSLVFSCVLRGPAWGTAGKARRG